MAAEWRRKTAVAQAKAGRPGSPRGAVGATVSEHVDVTSPRTRSRLRPPAFLPPVERAAVGPKLVRRVRLEGLPWQQPRGATAGGCSSTMPRTTSGQSGDSALVTVPGRPDVHPRQVNHRTRGHRRGRRCGSSEDPHRNDVVPAAAGGSDEDSNLQVL